MKCRNVLCDENNPILLGGCIDTLSSIKRCKLRKVFNRIDKTLKKDNFIRDCWKAELSKLKEQEEVDG